MTNIIVANIRVQTTLETAWYFNYGQVYDRDDRICFRMRVFRLPFAETSIPLIVFIILRIAKVGKLEKRVGSSWQIRTFQMTTIFLISSRFLRKTTRRRKQESDRLSLSFLLISISTRYTLHMFTGLVVQSNRD